MDFRVAVKAFIIKKNELLTLKRAPNDSQNPDIYELPGGRLKIGENPEEGLKREVKEEADLDIEILQPLNVQHFVRKDGQTITMIIYLCKALNNKIRLSEEHTKFEWLPLHSCKRKLADFFHEEVDIFNKLELNKHFKFS
ncbi:NUDIX domain-containing protein [Candidatus Woesearchaeota archaeon]|nr:NUDIX domain-containing protein [Candidatus Woesearchaeota archaeon]MBW3016481.1 NUDIX domain-containing protein [Candidatus Woesearchaeota archaeon]